MSGLSDFTKNTYARAIENIRKNIAPESKINDFLLNTDEIIKWIDSSKYATNSKKVFYIALTSTLRPTHPEASNIYKKKTDELNKVVTSNLEEQKLTQAEEAKYMTWQDILLCVEEKVFPAIHDLWTFQEYLIVSLYTLLTPMRLDYADMRVVKEEPQVIDKNYLVMTNEPYFLFGEYKTSKRYGVQRVVIPEKFVKIIKEWFDLLGGDADYLLYDTNGEAMPEWLLGQTIIKVFKKHAGKAVGVNMLRHSYATWIHQGEQSWKQMMATSVELAQKMCHSPSMNQMYRRLPPAQVD